MCLLLTMLFFLYLLPHGLAEEIPYHVTVEIIPLGPYPKSALPPGEADSEKLFSGFDKRNYSTFSAAAFPGWVFLGWQFDKSIHDLNSTIFTRILGNR